MKKILIFLGLFLLLTVVGSFLVWQQIISIFGFSTGNNPADRAQEKQLQELINNRRQQQLNETSADPFSDDALVKILFIGLDNRIGQTNGHCDAIQFIELNKKTQKITITAVPRGTYSPLPGKGHLSTDYYIAKACEVGGLDYGVKQIEKILGQKADYVVFIGFSQAIGIFRQLKLPANETMQWLRQRQGYAIGEPQRARNHSNFIKQMLIKYTPEIDAQYTVPAKYLIYKLLRTDLSYQQALLVATEVAKIDLPKHTERIKLLMRPAYDVKDISYDPEKIDSQLKALIEPIAKIIPEGAYTGISKNEAQVKIQESINKGLAEPDFVRWAFGNYLWLQIENDLQREQIHFDLLVKYIDLQTEQSVKEQIITDYVIEMEDLGQVDWAEKGKELLK